MTTHTDVGKASLAKSPVQYTLKRLFYNVYAPEIIKTMPEAEVNKLKAISQEAFEDEVIKRVFKQKDLMKSLTHHKDYTSFNVASASLQRSKLNELKNTGMLDYIALN